MPEKGPITRRGFLRNSGGWPPAPSSRGDPSPTTVRAASRRAPASAGQAAGQAAGAKRPHQLGSIGCPRPRRDLYGISARSRRPDRSALRHDQNVLAERPPTRRSGSAKGRPSIDTSRTWRTRTSTPWSSLRQSLARLGRLGLPGRQARLRRRSRAAITSSKAGAWSRPPPVWPHGRGRVSRTAPSGASARSMAF